MENEYNDRSEVNEEKEEMNGNAGAGGSRQEENKPDEKNYAYQNVIRNKNNSRTWSIVSLVLSILSVLCCCASWVALILAVLSVAFAGYSRKNLGYFDGLSLAGLIVGIFGIVFAVMGIVSNYLLNYSDIYKSIFEQYQEYLDGILKDGTFDSNEI